MCNYFGYVYCFSLLLITNKKVVPYIAKFSFARIVQLSDCKFLVEGKDL